MKATKTTSAAKKVPDGYRLMLVGPAGEVLDVIDLGGYQLGRELARSELANEVFSALRFLEHRG